MKRFLIAIALLGTVAFALPVAVRAQNVDEITYFDHAKKKEDIFKGVIQEESVGGIVCRVGTTAKTQPFPVADIVDVAYNIRPALNPKYRNARANEKRMEEAATEADKLKFFDLALKGYQELAKEKDLEESERGFRHVQYRIARLLAKRSEEDTEQREPATGALEKFIKAHGDADAWQLTSAVRLLGGFLEEKGDLAGAQKAYEVIASKALAPKDIKLEFQILSVRGLIRTNQHAAAEKKLKDVAATLQNNDPLLVRIKVYQAECKAAVKEYDKAQQDLTAILAGDADGLTKGVAHNVLGDCLRENGKLEDAFWNYLWVDVVYNQDRQEQARALYYLSKLFEQVKKDSTRAQQCRDRLLTKEFAGTDFQRRAAKEK